MKHPKILYIVILLSLLLSTACQNTEKEEASSKQDILPVVATSMKNETGKTQLHAKAENHYFMRGEEDGEFYLLVRVLGGKAKETKDKLPLNISLVVDRSGSMSDENKLEFVKEACNLVIDNLNEKDMLSVVAYDDWVRVLRKADNIAQKVGLKNTIKDLQPGGSTNLSGGMLEGYKQTKSTYESNMVNRVLLLSDGLANEGITDLVQLQNISQKQYQENRISISTFGVGADFNENLMTNLSEYGKGNYYFIDSPQKMGQIFEEELNGLLSVVAQGTKLHINFPKNLTVQEVFGFNSSMSGQNIMFDYNDVFSLEEKTILIKFKANKKLTKALTFDVELEFKDATNDNQTTKLKQQVVVKPTEDAPLYTKSFQEEVTRNKLLFIANQQLENATQEVDKGNYEQAKRLLKRNNTYLEEELKKVKPDSALLKQYKVNKEYQKQIQDIETMSNHEQKMWQKRSKDYNYKLKKKKIK